MRLHPTNSGTSRYLRLEQRLQRGPALTGTLRMPRQLSRPMAVQLPPQGTLTRLLDRGCWDGGPCILVQVVRLLHQRKLLPETVADAAPLR